MGFGLLKTKVNSKRHYVIVMAFAILLGVFTYTAVSPLRAYFSRLTAEPAVFSDQIINTNEYKRSTPIQLVIPTINLDTTFVPPLGLLADQTVSVPDSYAEVGWYSGGVSPGEIGSAVILGHVDSVDGPAVFYSLGQLKSGDEIIVNRNDGTTAVFVVTALKRYAQSDFPTELVYGQNDEAVLRLVTCTGMFNKSEQRYSHNLVVFAKLKNS